MPIKPLIVRTAGLVPRPIVRWLARLRLSNRFVASALASLGAFMRADVLEISHGPGRGMLIDCRGGKLSFALGTSEPEVQRLLVERLAEHDVFYDVGANVGFFTLIGARLVGPDGQVVAFEPSPTHAETLRQNVKRNDLQNVVVIEKAAFSSSGTGQLAPGPDPTGARLVRNDARGATEVELTTIDGLVEEGAIRAPTLVKLDVEGAELDVLHGMTRTLQSSRPIVTCELHGTQERFEELMAGLGYDVQIIEETVVDDNYHALATPRRDQPRAARTSS